MKPKPEDIVVQEMNLAQCRSNLRLLREKFTELSKQELALVTENYRLEGWFIDHGLPIPNNL